MALRKILERKEPVLYKVSHPVTAFDSKLHDLIDDMRETLAASGGVGLAAPQVGILRRVLIGFFAHNVPPFNALSGLIVFPSDYRISGTIGPTYTAATGRGKPVIKRKTA